MGDRSNNLTAASFPSHGREETTMWQYDGGYDLDWNYLQ